MDPLKLARDAGVLTMSALGEAVAGEPIPGSWWGHPAGKAIYAAAQALGASGDVVTVRLVEGKQTFVHRRLWPSLVRVATDPARRAKAMAGLAPLALRLLAEVERRDVVLDTLPEAWGMTSPAERKKQSNAATVLERGLLVLARQEHTAAGHHTRILTTFERWGVAPEGSYDEALSRLRT